ncbi:hypothetical protein [Oceanicola sp. 502str15]|uniref:hypothetical protein n=1 Tax=Oceanicola sp. 502str15 TaxID=2696061 RepID=UPI0020945758|nr:hypothetical protein [Oceanicola sp. 502str15]MCO6381439.1 hypothetical protein [Oceanicola sp. 502str15]
MRICLANGEFGPRPEPVVDTLPQGALHPGYFFPDAGFEERLGLNAALARLGAAMDSEGKDAAAPDDETLALVPLAAQVLLCFVTTVTSKITPPDFASEALLPLDRETMGHYLAQAHSFAPRPDPVLPPQATRLAEALAPLPSPGAALHWLLLHRLLPRLCDSATLAAVRATRAPLFAAIPEGPLLPLEFGVALLSAAPFRQPSSRHLALSYWFNIPTAQGVFTALRQADAPRAGTVPLLPRLERADLNRGDSGAVLVEHDLHKRTPLWFYLWREKALLGTEGRLGPLGARLLAEGMIGLVAETGNTALAHSEDTPPPPGTLEAWQAALG